MVTAVAVLFAGKLSGTDVVTLAVLLIAPGAAADCGTVNVATIVRVVPAGIVPSAHGNGVTQSPVFDTKVSPAGVGSSTTTAVASEGPALVTTIVYMTVPPGATVRRPVLTMDMSAIDGNHPEAHRRRIVSGVGIDGLARDSLEPVQQRAQLRGGHGEIERRHAALEQIADGPDAGLQIERPLTGNG